MFFRAGFYWVVCLIIFFLSFQQLLKLLIPSFQNFTLIINHLSISFLTSQYPWLELLSHVINRSVGLPSPIMLADFLSYLQNFFLKYPLILLVYFFSSLLSYFIIFYSLPGILSLYHIFICMTSLPYSCINLNYQWHQLVEWLNKVRKRGGDVRNAEGVLGCHRDAGLMEDITEENKGSKQQLPTI
jgi:hypothetical protein